MSGMHVCSAVILSLSLVCEAHLECSIILCPRIGETLANWSEPSVKCPRTNGDLEHMT